MKRKLLYGSVGLLLLTGCAFHRVPFGRRAPQDLSSDKIQAALDEAEVKGKLPGLAVLAIARGKDVYFRSQGRRSVQHEAKVENNDSWHLGSDTKAMTAFLIAMAVEQGKVQYQTRLIDFFGPSYRFHELNKDLTLGSVLTHTSGLKDVQEVRGGKLWKELVQSKKDVQKQRIEMIKAAFAEAPHLGADEPRRATRAFRYGNINYVIAGAVLEKVYGQSWETSITQKLFQPLGMSSCGFGVAGDPNEKEPSQPWPHVVVNVQVLGVPPKEKLDNPPMLGPAGTVHCNLRDWSKFISELIRVWKGQGTLLKNESIAKQYFTVSPAGFYTFGGWGRDDKKFGTPSFAHHGSNTFNYATAFFAPEKEVMVLMATNTGNPEASAAMIKLEKFVSEGMMAPE